MTKSTPIFSDVLFSKWEWNFPQFGTMDDWMDAIEIFVRIAHEKVFAKNECAYTLTNRSVEPLTEGLMVSEIKQFIEEHALVFWKACNSGFPFHLLKGKNSGANSFDTSNDKLALTVFLEKDVPSSILEIFMQLEGVEDCLRKMTVTDQFFSNINPREIGFVCRKFKELYLRRDNAAGYYLLYLLKITAKCSFKIPAQEHFGASTVREVISSFLKGPKRPFNPQMFFTILGSRDEEGSSPLFDGLLDEEALSKLIDMYKNALKLIPEADWKDKEACERDFQEIMSMKSL